MNIERLSGSVLTVTLFGSECEELATILGEAEGHNDPAKTGTLSGFFLAAALVCKIYANVNLSEDVQEKLDAIVKKVTRWSEEGGDDA
jgi:hypothetical protein